MLLCSFVFIEGKHFGERRCDYVCQGLRRHTSRRLQPARRIQAKSLSILHFDSTFKTDINSAAVFYLAGFSSGKGVVGPGPAGEKCDHVGHRLPRGGLKVHRRQVGGVSCWIQHASPLTEDSRQESVGEVEGGIQIGLGHRGGTGRGIFACAG